jgi:YggT family protein
LPALKGLAMSMSEKSIPDFKPIDIKSMGLLATVAASQLPIAAYASEDVDFTAAMIARPLLDWFVYIMNFLFICRTVISWYPKTDIRKFPFNAIIWPTEPLLVPVRELVPPAFGVDVSAIVWIMLLSFFREILTGQQGILTLLERS